MLLLGWGVLLFLISFYSAIFSAKISAFPKQSSIFVGYELQDRTERKETENKNELEKVIKGSLWEAELVKGLLKDRGILSTIKDGLVVNVALPETAIDVQVLVNEVDFEAAMDVIRERSSQTLGE